MNGDNFPEIRGHDHIRSNAEIIAEYQREHEVYGDDDRHNIIVYLFGAAVIALLLVFFVFCTPGRSEENWSDEEIVNAIRKAEGVWTYGIKSVKCETEKECRKICFNTVRNNRKRYEVARNKRLFFGDYVSFLQKRYCPVGARNDPKGLNKNWLKNVRYFLAKGRAK